ncbi:MAG: apolipoprotein N-acyltransferase [Candidatus Omnitrophica bacterium]|nr:apolipoprotein N-acyltransferase [Candidatus Omnitrophota bacterium]
MLRTVTGINKRDYGLCLISGLLLSLPFSNPAFSLFIWFGFIPLFFALKDKKFLSAFILAYSTGIVFWAVTIYWLVNVTLFGTALLVLYLSLYFGFFGLILSAYSLKLKTTSLMFLPSVWVFLEYLRSHLLTGFPWVLLGYSQYLNLQVIQIADIAGVWVVSFFIVMVNTTIYSLFNLQPPVFKKSGKLIILPAVLLIAIFIYGFYRMNIPFYAGKDSSAKPVKLSVIQPNIPQGLKWYMHSRAFIMQRYFELTNNATKDNPDLIIWPEAALPVVLEEEPHYYLSLRDYIKSIHKPLLFGAVTFKDNLYYNSALLLSGKADLLKQYDKLHLVPFGEYIPFRNILKFLDTIAPIGDIARGKDYTIFEFPDNFGVLICFEDVFPELARGFVRKGAKFLINITNDAWFGKTSEAYQHMAASVLRAVENRVYLVRAANTGVSAFISPSGRIISLVSGEKGDSIFIQGHKTEDIYISDSRAKTFYNRYGDFFPIFCLLIAILSVPYALLHRLRKEGAS